MPSVTLPSDFATACAAAASGVCPPNGDGVQATVAYFADPTLLVEARRAPACMSPGSWLNLSLNINHTSPKPKPTLAG